MNALKIRFVSANVLSLFSLFLKAQFSLIIRANGKLLDLCFACFIFRIHAMSLEIRKFAADRESACVGNANVKESTAGRTAKDVLV